MENFIVVEGIDGSGKTTFCERLSHDLTMQGVDHWVTSEPTQALRDKMASGYAPTLDDFIEDRKAHAVEIKEALDRGEYVICDRYLFSTFVYQNVPVERMKDVISGIPMPDTVFFIDTPCEEAYRRIIERGNGEEQSLEQLRALAERYDLFSKFFVIIDGTISWDTDSAE